VVFLILGFISLILGIAGVFLPILPTTPFLLLAAACFSKGSKKLYNKLINNRLVGAYIKNYREGKGVPIKVKVLTLLLLWISISYTAIFIVEFLFVRILLLLIAIGVTGHLLWVKTYKE
jgi:uncharacterized protein